MSSSHSFKACSSHRLSRKIVGSHARWLHVKRFHNLNMKGYFTKYLRKQVLGFVRDDNEIAVKSSALLRLTNARGLVLFSQLLKAFEPARVSGLGV